MSSQTPTVAAPGFERPGDRDDELRAPAGIVRFLDVPTHRFVMIDGDGPPGDATFTPRMPGLYATAYPLRFALKRRGIECRVGPLEGLWWTVGGATHLDAILDGEHDDWRWTLMIGLPDEATDGELADALSAGRERLEAPYAASLRIESYMEGSAAQVMHLGPYSAERPTIERLHATVAAAGLRLRGPHHELYLGDPRRSAPERLRTLIRHGVE